METLRNERDTQVYIPTKRALKEQTPEAMLFFVAL
jgi:hypothetical protein